MNRHQRRALEKKIAGSPIGSPLRTAASQIKQATAALEGLQGLDGLPAQMQDALQLMRDAHTTIDALVEDYQTLANALEALKLVVLRDPAAAALFDQHHTRIQSERSE